MKKFLLITSLLLSSLSAFCITTYFVTAFTFPTYTGATSFCIGTTPVSKANFSNGGTYTVASTANAAVNPIYTVTVTVNGPGITGTVNLSTFSTSTSQDTLQRTFTAAAAPFTEANTRINGTTGIGADIAAFMNDPSRLTGTYNFNLVLTFTQALPSPNAIGAKATSSISNTLSFTINPLPTAITGNTGALCVAGTETIVSGGGTGTYGTVAAARATINAASGLVTGAATAVQDTCTVYYNITATGCKATTVITTNPLPTITLGASPSVCSGVTTVNLPYTATTNSPTTYSITFNAAALSAGFSNVTNATLNPTNVLITGVPTATATYNATSIQVTNANGCVSSAANPFTITVNASPTAITGNTGALCVAGTETIVSGGGTGTYGTVAAARATINAASGLVTGAATAVQDTCTVYYNITATGCKATTVITTNPLPTITLGASPSVCSGVTTVNLPYTATTNAPTLYSIVFNAAAHTAGFRDTTNVSLDASNVFIPVPSSAAAATYTATSIKVTNANGCVSSAANSFKVKINTNPAAITGNTPICVGNTKNLADATGGGTWNSVNTSQATVSATGVVTAQTTSVQDTTTIFYNVTATGCIATTVITVNPNPAALTGNSGPLCVAGTLTVADATPSGTFGTVAAARATIGATTGLVTGVATAVQDTCTVYYNVTATGCKATTVITTNPLPTITLGVSPAVCQTITTVNLPYTATTNSPTTYSITFNAAALSAGFTNVTNATLNPTNVLITVPSAAAAAVYNATSLKVTNANGCVSTAVNPFTVTVNTKATAVSGNTGPICVGGTRTLASGGGVGTWNSVNTANATVSSGGGVVTGQTTAVQDTCTVFYNITASGCKATTVITTNPLPTITLGTDPAVCQGITTVNLPYTAVTNSPTSFNITYSPAAITAGFANVSNTTLGSSNIVLAVPVAAAAATYTGTVNVVNANNCSSSAGVGFSVTVNTKPSATITGTATICNGASTAISVSGGTALSTITLSPSGSFTLDGSGTGSTNVSPSSTTTFTGTVSLGSCSQAATGSLVISVNPLPTAVSGNTGSICVGNTLNLTSGGGTGTWNSVNTTQATISSSTGVVTGQTTTVQDTTTVFFNITASGCKATTVITVNPLPTITLGTNPSVCSGITTVNLPYTAVTNAPTSFNITYSPAAISAGFSNVSNTTLSASNIVLTVPAAAAAATYSGTVNVVNANGCTSSTGVAFTVTITALPTATITGTTAICNGSSTSISVSGGTASATIALSPSGSITLNGSGAGSTTVNPVTTTTYTGIVSLSGCSQAATGSVTISVNNPPTFTTNPSSTSICVGGNTTLSSTASTATSYQWFRSTGGAYTAISSSSLDAGVTYSGFATSNLSISATTTGANGYTYEVVATGSGACTTTSSIATLGILVVPTATITTPTAVCSGSPVSLTATTTGSPTTFLWVGSNLSSSTSLSTTATPTATTTYSLTVTNAVCSSAVYTTTATVSGSVAPTASISIPAAICVGGTASLTATTTGSPTTFVWAGSNLASTSNLTTTATPTITTVYSLTVSNGGCTSPQYTTTVTVNAIPTATITPPAAICAGGTSSLTATTTGSPTSFLWVGSNLASSTSLTTTATPTVTSTYSLTVSNSGSGCTSSVYTTTATITTIPTATITTPAAICAGGTTSLTASTTGSPTTFLWVGSNLASSTSLTTTATPTATTTYSLTVSNGSCSSSIYTTTATVNTVPTATITTPSAICSGGIASLTATTTGSPTTYLWAGSNIASTTSLTTTATPTTTTTYSLTVSTGACSSVVYTTSATVNTTPTATITTPAAICNGGTSSLTATTTGSPTTFTWAGSNLASTTLLTTTATPTITSVYSLTVSNGLCTSTVNTTTATVNQLPTITLGTSPSVCSGITTVNLPYTAVTNAPTSFNITYSSAAISAGFVNVSNTTLTASNIKLNIPSSVAAAAYSGTVNVVNANGCNSSTGVAFTVTVKTTPSASLTGTTNICSGTSTSISVTGGTPSATITLSPSGSITLNGSGAGSVTVNPITTTTYTGTVSLSGCSQAATGIVTVTVNNAPVFTANPVSSTICTGSGTSFSATTTGATDFQWYRGIGGTYQALLFANTDFDVFNISYGSSTYSTNSLTLTTTSSAGTGFTYYLVATSAFGCADTSSIATLTINDYPTATITTPTTICVGGTASLTATTTGSPTTFLWVGSNLASSTSLTTTATPTATTTYSLTVSTGSCISSVYTTTATVTAVPTATINATTAICAGGTTSLTATTSGSPTIYSWSGSNLVSSTDLNTTATPTVTSIYSLTVSTASCSSTVYTITANVNTSPTPISGNSAALCVGNTETLGSSGTGTWSSLNTTNATVTSSTGIVTAKNTAVQDTTTIIYTLTSSGCQATTVVTVNPNPSAITGNSALCVGITETLASSNAGTWSSLNTTNATVDIASGVVTANATVVQDTTTIVYALNTTGCYVTTVITVNPAPSAITGNSALCAGNTEALTASGTGTWVSINTTNATVSSSGVVTANAISVQDTTTVAFTLTATGCQATTVITVNPLPTAISGNSALCGSNNELLTSSGTGTWTSLNTANATVGSSTGIVTGVSTSVTDTTTVYYALSGTGCYVTTVITVNPGPSAITNTATGSSTFCVLNNDTLSNSSAAGTWSSSNPTVATILSTTSGSPSTTVISGLTSGTATIVYQLSGCSATYPVTVSAGPSAITGNTPVCVNSNLTLSDAGGTTWSTSSVSVASITNSGVVIAHSNGNTNITYTNTSTGCYAATIVTVNPLPNAISGSTSSLCPGTSVLLSDATPGGSWSTSSSSIASISPTSTIFGVSAGSATITYTLASTGCYATFPITVNVKSWLGTAGNSWNTAANWTCGTIPVVTDNIYITNATVFPVISGSSALCNDLHINTGDSVTVNSGLFLNVHGNLYDTGTITGSGIVELNGSSAQTIYGTGNVYNMDLNNSTGATINNTTMDSLHIKGNLTITSGTLTTNSQLVIYSDTFGNGTIGQITGGSISGGVVDYQWIPGTKRAYIFWSTPFSSTTSLLQLITYIDISGAGQTTNCFTASTSPSGFRYDPLLGNSSASSDPGWRPFTNICSGANDTNKLHQYQGMRFFYRGSKGEGIGLSGIGSGAYVINSTTIQQSGTVNQGTQTVTLTKGSVTVAGNPVQDYNLIGNPYLCPVDVATAVNASFTAGNLISKYFYVYNSRTYTGTPGGYGVYETHASDAGSYYLQANESIFVRAANNGATISFQESYKGSTYTTLLLRNEEAIAKETIDLEVLDSKNQPWDKLTLQFNNQATDAEEGNFDAGKFPNDALNLYSFSSSLSKLSVDVRPYQEGKVIPLGFNTSVYQDYTLKANNYTISNGNVAYLHDKLLNKYITLTEGANYTFTASDDEHTQGDNRFEITLGRLGEIVNANSNLELTIVPNPASSKVTLSYFGNNQESAILKIYDVVGTTVYEKQLDGANSVTSIDISSFASGVYLVEYTVGNQKVVKRLIKN